MNTVVALIDGLPEASPKLRDYSRLLREQLRLSERIITDVLDRARSGAPVRSRVDVSQLLDEVASRAVRPGHIRVVREDDAPLPPVWLDRDHVGQIVWNLITNAVQAIQGHSPQGGTVTVGASVAAGRLRIQVRDTGPGLGPERRSASSSPCSPRRWTVSGWACRSRARWRALVAASCQWSRPRAQARRFCLSCRVRKWATMAARCAQ